MSAMGQAGGEGQAQAEGQGRGAEAQGPDLSGMVEQLGTLSSGMEEIRQLLPILQQQQQGQQEGEAEQDQGSELDLSWLDQPQTLEADPAMLQQRLTEQISGLVDQRAQALTAPMAEQMTEMRRDQQARDLAAEFPELAEPERAQKIAGKGGLAEQMATQLGRPELAAEPSFWRLVHMADKAAEAANAENGSGGPEAARLESGSGPGPAAPRTEADLVNDIVNAGDGLGKRVLDFRQ